MPLRLLSATALALALSASPAAAATLAELKPCYVSAGEADGERETVVVAGDGFAAMSTVEVLFDGVAQGSAPTGSVGEFEIRLPAPYQRSGERAFTLAARDGVNSVVTQSRVTDLDVAMRPKRAAPSRKVRFRGRGFTLQAAVFAHYLFGGTEQKTVRLAKTSTAPCGTFKVKRRQIPVAHARTGRWIVQVDQKRAYSPQPDPVWVRLPIQVEEVFLEP